MELIQQPLCRKMSWVFFILSVLCFNSSVAQDTIHWRSNYTLKWKDFQGKPDTTVIDLAVCASEITYVYKIVNEKLVFSIDCFFDKKRSWIKYNMQAILDHEQGHFDISKLYSLKLAEKFETYKVNLSTIDQDLSCIYRKIIQEREEMHHQLDKIEAENPTTNIPQKKFIQGIRKKIFSKLK